MGSNLATKPLLVIGKQQPQAPQMVPAPAGQPIPQGPTVYDANFEYTTRLNALNLADRLLDLAEREAPERKERLKYHAYLLIDEMVAPKMSG